MAEPLRIAVCEDSESDRDRLLDILSKSKTENTVSVFQSGEEFLKAFCPGSFDLVLMDIYMSGITGTDAVAKIRTADENIPVAFVTADKDHALESYRLAALGYIEKPANEKQTENILRLAKMQKDAAPSLTVQHNRKEEKIPFSHILMLEQQSHKLFIHTKSGENIEIYDKLSNILPLLPERDFFCPHKSFCVNLSFVKFVDSELKCFVMSDGYNVPIRRESVSKAKKALEAYIFSRTRGFCE